MTETPQTPARKATISSRLSGELRADILRGSLAPGAKINLDRLRERFDISISPLREAVARLVGDGLVEFEDQRGYRVAEISPANLREVTGLRAQLEGMALRASIEGGDLEWESNVMRALYHLKRTDQGENPAAWEAVHSDFHRALITGCNQPLLLQFCTITQNLNDRYRQLMKAALPDARDLSAEHEEIALAATARQADTACAALQAHILQTGEGLLRCFTAAQSEGPATAWGHVR